MKNILYFLSVFSFITCSVKNNEKQKTEGEMNVPFVVNPRVFEKDNLSLSTFAEDIIYVPLSNKLLIGAVHILRVTANAIYLIYDNSGSGEGNGHPQLFRFDRNGENPVQIGRIGKGPEEYLSANLFAVDEKNNRIYISGKVNTILVFDTLGNYLREFKFQIPKLSFSRLNILGSNKLLLPQHKLGAQGECLWYVIDTLGNVISSKKNSTPHFETHTGPYSGTFRYEDKLMYWIDYNDTIFEISSDLTYNALSLIAPDEPRNYELNSRLPAASLLKPSEGYLPRLFQETDHYLINRYSYKGEYAFAFINKETRKTYTCSYKLGRDITGGIPNDYDSGVEFFPLEYFTSEGREYLVAIIQPYEFIARIATTDFKNSIPKYPKKKRELEELANRLRESDNPVLMLVKLKE